MHSGHASCRANCCGDVKSIAQGESLRPLLISFSRGQYRLQFLQGCWGAMAGLSRATSLVEFLLQPRSLVKQSSLVRAPGIFMPRKFIQFLVGEGCGNLQQSNFHSKNLGASRPTKLAAQDQDLEAILDSWRPTSKPRSTYIVSHPTHIPSTSQTPPASWPRRPSQNKVLS